MVKKDIAGETPSDIGADIVSAPEARPTAVSISNPNTREQKHPQPEAQSVMVSVWRLIFLIAMVILGCVLGYELGSVVAPAIAGMPMLQSPDNRITFSKTFMTFQECGLGAIFGLIAFLSATAAFRKMVSVGEALQHMRANEKLAILFGLLAGLLVTLMLSPILLNIKGIGLVLTILVAVVMAYWGVVAMMSMRDELWILRPSTPAPAPEAEAVTERIKILDTNVIIDGRVSDVCRTGFIEGPIYVPGFVLEELQHIADSADALKRARGRRGLDILNQMRNELPLIVRTLDNKMEAQSHEEVDAKLVRLAKRLDGAIVTNDFNLNKVAALQGVSVLNINELANALKPVVLPGEEMIVTVIKEGKESNQGIGYLDDGTMIVIEGGRRRIGENLDVVVTSVLQTVAGKMIFATIRQNEDGSSYDDGDNAYDPGSRPYPGGRSRRPLR
jgi:uncharacterized protein YacL